MALPTLLPTNNITAFNFSRSAFLRLVKRSVNFVLPSSARVRRCYIRNFDGLGLIKTWFSIFISREVLLVLPKSRVKVFLKLYLHSYTFKGYYFIHKNILWNHMYIRNDHEFTKDFIWLWNGQFCYITLLSSWYT